jgi:hypothetical protein
MNNNPAPATPAAQREPAGEITRQAAEPEKYLLITVTMVARVTGSAALRAAAISDFDQYAGDDGEDNEIREGLAADDAYAAYVLANPCIGLEDLFPDPEGCGLADAPRFGTCVSVGELDGDTFEQARDAEMEHALAGGSRAGLRPRPRESADARWITGIPGHAPKHPRITRRDDGDEAGAPVWLTASCTCGDRNCYWSWQTGGAVRHPGRPTLSVTVSSRKRGQVHASMRIYSSTTDWAGQPHGHVPFIPFNDRWNYEAEAALLADAGREFAAGHGYRVAGEFCRDSSGALVADLTALDGEDES